MSNDNSPSLSTPQSNPPALGGDRALHVIAALDHEMPLDLRLEVFGSDAQVEEVRWLLTTRKPFLLTFSENWIAGLFVQSSMLPHVANAAVRYYDASAPMVFRFVGKALLLYRRDHWNGEYPDYNMPHLALRTAPRLPNNGDIAGWLLPEVGE